MKGHSQAIRSSTHPRQILQWRKTNTPDKNNATQNQLKKKRSDKDKTSQKWSAKEMSVHDVSYKNMDTEKWSWRASLDEELGVNNIVRKILSSGRRRAAAGPKWFERYNKDKTAPKKTPPKKINPKNKPQTTSQKKTSNEDITTPNQKSLDKDMIIKSKLSQKTSNKEIATPHQDSSDKDMISPIQDSSDKDMITKNESQKKTSNIEIATPNQDNSDKHMTAPKKDSSGKSTITPNQDSAGKTWLTQKQMVNTWFFSRKHFRKPSKNINSILKSWFTRKRS